MTASSFGKRGLIGAPTMGAPGTPPPPTTRRLRSSAVAIGAVGALTLGIAASADWGEHRCGPRPTASFDPNSRMCAQICSPTGVSGEAPALCEDLCKTPPKPAGEDPDWCHAHGGGHSHSGGHSWGSSSHSGSGGGFFGLGHASFGGFGGHGFGHGGG